MDHLTRPFGVELTEDDEVPYVSSDDYHKVPFLEYVKTKEAYQVAADMVDASTTSLYEPTLVISELERFLQTWLFFGLLQETLGELFDQDDFVRGTHFKVVISTKTLPGKLRQWMNDPNLDQKRLTHLHQCLKMTLQSVVDQLQAELDAAGKTLPDSGLGFTHQRRKSILGLLSRFYRNRYLVKARDFPVTQEYCLD